MLSIFPADIAEDADGGSSIRVNPNLPGEMQVTVILKPVSCGTEVTITQEGVPTVIPADMCYLGWQESLTQLAMLVEPDIPNG